MRVDIWSDVICPFCYVGKKRFENVAKSMDIEIEWVWHAFELEPGAPKVHSTPNIEIIQSKYNCSLEMAYQHQRNVEALCATENISFNWEHVKPGNTLDAHRVLKLAEACGIGDIANEAFFEAYMNKGKAIGEPDAVMEIALSLGLYADDVKSVLNSDRYLDEVRKDQELARQLQITSVPYFVINEKYVITGAQSREAFGQALSKARLDSVQTISVQGMSCSGGGCSL